MYTEVTVKFKIRHLGTAEDIDNAVEDWFCTSREEMVKLLIEEESLMGIVEKEYDIVKIEFKED